MTPRIGLTTYARNEDNWFQLPAEYVDSVRRAGGLGEMRTYVDIMLGGAPEATRLSFWDDLVRSANR